METLLVAEDEEIVRMFMKKILERAGYKVIIADNGEDAVARFREHDDISLVLSDVVMPRKNGKEMLDEIRKIKPGIKVVFISGYAADVMQKKGIVEEGTEFITKPFNKKRSVAESTRSSGQGLKPRLQEISFALPRRYMLTILLKRTELSSKRRLWRSNSAIYGSSELSTDGIFQQVL